MPLTSAVQAGHVVHFYDSDSGLALAVAEFLGPALCDQGAALVVATPAHRLHIARTLEDAGVDVAAARAGGAYLEVDAGELLSTFLVNGSPDRARFEYAVLPVLARGSAGRRPLRVFGEMVDILWQRGDVQAAHDTEMLWNTAGAGKEFDLFCGYASYLVSGDAPARKSIVHHHETAVPEVEEAEPDGGVRRRFQPTLLAAGAARRFVRETLTEWGRAELIADAELVVSELATNAVTHTGRCFDVTVRGRDRQAVHIAVTDASQLPPAIRRGEPDETTGRGVRIVAAVAGQWGTRSLPSGKTVWAELMARPEDAPDGCV